MLVLSTEPSCLEEVSWIADVIFSDFLGVAYQIKENETDGFCLKCDGKTLRLPNCFLGQLCGDRKHPTLLPTLPLATWNLNTSILNVPRLTEALPILFGMAKVDISENCIKLGVDVFGTAFFMLSRYEETVVSTRDAHNRFPATASFSYKAGFLDRPIVDEYVEVLWAAMQRLWPGLERKPRQGETRVTCDVDAPFELGATSAIKLVRSIAGDVLKRRDVSKAVLRIQNCFASRRQDYSYDVNYTFEWYMDICEKAGRKAAFYFITEHSAGAIDGCYEIDDPKILNLMQYIDERGHELGVHGSYNTYQSSGQIQCERDRMLTSCELAGVTTEVKGNRQHFLRWDTLLTADYLDAAGYEYDTTGSFADMPGFRYGTARPFVMWSWQKHASLRIKQKPLVLMECSVISDRYMGLGYSEESMATMQRIKQRALSYGGDFTLLWHNCHLTTDQDKSFFAKLVL